MTDSEKLKEVIEQLKRWTFPDEHTHSEDYWMEVDLVANNAVDYVCDMDITIKKLIQLIEAP